MSKQAKISPGRIYIKFPIKPNRGLLNLFSRYLLQISSLKYFQRETDFRIFKYLIFQKKQNDEKH